MEPTPRSAKDRRVARGPWSLPHRLREWISVAWSHPVHRASHGSPGTNLARSSLTRQRPPSPSMLLALSPGRVGPGVQKPRTDAPFLSWGTAWLHHSVESLRASVRGQKARGPRGCPPPSPPSHPLLCSLVVQLAGCCPSAGAVENRGPPTPGSQACQHTPGPRARSPTRGCGWLDGSRDSPSRGEAE